MSASIDSNASAPSRVAAARAAVDAALSQLAIAAIEMAAAKAEEVASSVDLDVDTQDTTSNHVQVPETALAVYERAGDAYIKAYKPVNEVFSITELTEKVLLSGLDMRNIMQLREVNKFFKRTIENSAPIQERLFRIPQVKAPTGRTYACDLLNPLIPTRFGSDKDHKPLYFLDHFQCTSSVHYWEPGRKRIDVRCTFCTFADWEWSVLHPFFELARSGMDACDESGVRGWWESTLVTQIPLRVVVALVEDEGGDDQTHHTSFKLGEHATMGDLVRELLKHGKLIAEMYKAQALAELDW
nr:hypothetical protein B0A51_01795 [Rachicladosporium sp. CCFEE 5018]